MKKVLVGIIVCFFTIVLMDSSAFAVNFQIDRGKVRIKMPPGWSDGGVINIKNKGIDPLKIRVYVTDWSYSDSDGAKNFMPAGTQPNSCAEWIKFYPADVTLPGDSAKELNYVVAIPPDAVGGHYAVLFFEAMTGTTWDESKGVNVNVYHRLASLFYVEPEGTIKKQAEISDFKVKRPAGSIELEAMFENVGNVDILAKGTFDIIDEKGFVFTRGRFEDIYTMSKEKAKLYAKGSIEKIPSGRYDVILTFDLEGDILVKEYRMEVSRSGSVDSIQESE